MTQIILIRHGENDYVKKDKLAGRLPGVHLNEKGQAQAKALAAGLKGEKLAAVYSSPMDRAIETAKPLARAQALKVVERWGLEETDLGDWQGKSMKRLARSKAWKQLQNRPSLFRFPGGESIYEQQIRLVKEIEELLSMHEEKDTIACVGHADPIKVLVAHYLGLGLDLFQRILVSPASISRLHFADGRFMLGSLNERFDEGLE